MYPEIDSELSDIVCRVIVFLYAYIIVFFGYVLDGVNHSPTLGGGLMVNLGGYRIVDVMEITSKVAEWNATGRK